MWSSVSFAYVLATVRVALSQDENASPTTEAQNTSAQAITLQKPETTTLGYVEGFLDKFFHISEFPVEEPVTTPHFGLVAGFLNSFFHLNDTPSPTEWPRMIYFTTADPEENVTLQLLEEDMDDLRNYIQQIRSKYDSTEMPQEGFNVTQETTTMSFDDVRTWIANVKAKYYRERPTQSMPLIPV